MDGHGGRDVMEYIKKNFSKEFLAEYRKNGKDIHKTLTNTFVAVQALFYMYILFR